MKNESITLNVNGITITASSTMRGKCNGTKLFPREHYTYNLKVWSDLGTMSVVYHDSIYNFNEGIKKLDKEALIDAMQCIASDISLYLNDEIKDVYEDSATIKMIERGCKKEYESFKNVVGNDENIWSAIEKLNELY